MPALAEIPRSLETFGHDPLQLVFTDNVRGDKPELERVMPDLVVNVVPVPDASVLEHLTLPPPGSGHDIITLSTSFQVNTRLASIMEDISTEADVFVALDMEWPVDRANGLQGRVALISFTFGREIFLLHVCLHYIHSITVI